MNQTILTPTSQLIPGTRVYTRDDGIDFDIPLVRPTRGRIFGTPREVRSVVGGVVRFTDGTKSRRLNGHTGWLEA
jgi:hypothetical protein